MSDAGGSSSCARSGLWGRAASFLQPLTLFLSRLPPAKLVLLGYTSYAMVGWALLCLPWAAARGSAADHLFVAVSALSTTGLSPLSVSGDYTLFGRIVILALVQAGGLGYMTLGSFILLSRKSALTGVRLEVGRAVFSLPESFRLDKFIVSVVRFTFGIELAGALVLWPLLARAGLPHPLWSAVFHSISSFCTAGFSLYDDSFVAFAGDFWVNAVIAALSYAGAIGFIVFVDYGRMLRGKVEQVTLTSRIIINMTLWMTALGTASIFLAEPTLYVLPADKRLLASFFQCMTAMTTVGFNTVPIGGLASPSLVVIIALMVVGASPAGTGGGIKTTSFSALLGVIGSAMRGENGVSFFGRSIPLERVWIALANIGIYLMALVAGVFILTLTENFDLRQLAFEAASAIGTVGLSMGITSQLSVLGKLTITALMFCGRVGPLTLGAALFIRGEKNRAVADSDLAV